MLPSHTQVHGAGGLGFGLWYYLLKPHILPTDNIMNVSDCQQNMKRYPIKEEGQVAADALLRALLYSLRVPISLFT